VGPANVVRCLCVGVLALVTVRPAGAGSPMELSKEGAVVGTKCVVRTTVVAPASAQIARLTVLPPEGVTVGAPFDVTIVDADTNEPKHGASWTFTVDPAAAPSQRKLTVTLTGPAATATADFWIEPRRMILFAIDGLSWDLFKEVYNDASDASLRELLSPSDPARTDTERSVNVKVRTTFPPITWSRWTTVFSGRTAGAMHTAGTGWLNRAALLPGGDDTGDVVQGTGVSDLAMLRFMYFSSGAFNRNAPLAAPPEPGMVYADLRARGLRSVVVLSPAGYGVKEGDDPKNDRWDRLSPKIITSMGKLITAGTSAFGDEYAWKMGRGYVRDGDFNLLVIHFLGLDHQEHAAGVAAGKAWFSQQIEKWIKPVVSEAEQRLHGTVVYGLVADHGLFDVDPARAVPYETFKAALALRPAFRAADHVREDDGDRAIGRLAACKKQTLNVVYSAQGGMANVYVADGAQAGDARVVKGDWRTAPSLETLEPIVDALHASYLEPYIDPKERPVAAILVRRRDAADPSNFDASHYAVVPLYYEGNHLLTTCGASGALPCTLANQLLGLDALSQAEWGVTFEADAQRRLDGYASANSGDIVLLANADYKFYFGKPGSNRGQHGALTPLDSRVPLVFFYPGATGTKAQDDTLDPIEDQLSCHTPSLDHLASAPGVGPLESPVEAEPIRAYFGLPVACDRVAARLWADREEHLTAQGHARRAGHERLRRRPWLTDDQAVLGEMALKDPDAHVRRHAAHRLRDNARLLAIAQSDADPRVRAAAVDAMSAPELLRGLLADKARGRGAAGTMAVAPPPAGGPPPAIDDALREKAVERLAELGSVGEAREVASRADRSALHWSAAHHVSDRKRLLHIAEKDGDPAAQRAAVARVEDQKALAKIAQSGSADPNVREDAIRRLTDGAVLKKIALGDADSHLATIAVWGVSDVTALEEVAAKSRWRSAQRAARRRARELAGGSEASGLPPEERASTASPAPPPASLVARRPRRPVEPSEAEARVAQVQGLTDQTELARRAREDQTPGVRAAAVAKIEDQAALAEIVTRDPHPQVRRAAVARLSDQGLCRDVATRDSDQTVRAVAATRISDPALLAELARTAPDANARAFAVAHLTDAVLVKQVSKSDASNLVRQRAKARLAALRSKR
jgi:hypothetical protein